MDDDNGKAHEHVLRQSLRQAEEMQVGEVDAFVETNAQEILEVNRACASSGCRARTSRSLWQPSPQRASVPTNALEGGREEKQEGDGEGDAAPLLRDLAEVEARTHDGATPQDSSGSAYRRVAQQSHFTLVHEKTLQYLVLVLYSAAQCDALALQRKDTKSLFSLSRLRNIGR